MLTGGKAATECKLRPVDAGTVARVDALLTRAYESPSRLADLELYIRAQPDSMWAVWDGDEPVAAAGFFIYGTLAWLGLVATDPAYRGHGLTTRLSEHLVGLSFEHG